MKCQWLVDVQEGDANKSKEEINSVHKSNSLID